MPHKKKAPHRPDAPRPVSRELIAEALLDAHLRFVMDQISGPELPVLLGELVDGALAQSAHLTLNSVVTRQMVKDTARAYASELELSGGIPELVSEIARAVYNHKAHKQMTLGQLLPEAHLKELLDKLLELKSLRERLIREAVNNPLYAAFATDLLYRGISGYLASSPLTRGIPGAHSVLKLGRSVLAKARPGMGDTIEDNLKKYIAKSVRSIAAKTAERLIVRADPGSIREAALEFWANIKHTPVAALRRDIASLDVEELLVILYEYWRELRKSDYYVTLINAGIDAFFDRFGETTLRELLDELGVGRDIMLTEALRYAPHVLKALNQKQVLEPIVRRQLERFYRSAGAKAVLSGTNRTVRF